MKMSLGEKFEQVFTAVAFAEAGEFETAREIMREGDRDVKSKEKVKRPAPRMQAPGAKR